MFRLFEVDRSIFLGLVKERIIVKISVFQVLSPVRVLREARTPLVFGVGEFGHPKVDQAGLQARGEGVVCDERKNEHDVLGEVGVAFHIARNHVRQLLCGICHVLSIVRLIEKDKRFVIIYIG